MKIFHGCFLYQSFQNQLPHDYEETESRTDVAFYFMAGARCHHQSGAGCTGTLLLEVKYFTSWSTKILTIVR
jgi:hypothetical protein